MEDHNNNLTKETMKLIVLNMELENKLDDQTISIDLRQKVQATQSSIELSKRLIVASVIKYEKVCKDVELQGSKLFNLEKKLLLVNEIALV
jgi:hypothetical protein